MLKKLRTPAAFVPMARRIPEQVSCLVTKPTSDKIVMSHSLIGCHIHLGGTKGFFDQHATERDLVSEILKSRKVKGRSVWLEAETAVKGGQMGITMADSDGGVVVSEFGEARFHQCLRNGSAAISFLDTKARAVTKRFRKSSDLKRDFQAGWSLAGVEPNNAGYGAMQSSVDMKAGGIEWVAHGVLRMVDAGDFKIHLVGVDRVSEFLNRQDFFLSRREVNEWR